MHHCYNNSTFDNCVPSITNQILSSVPSSSLRAKYYLYINAISNVMRFKYQDNEAILKTHNMVVISHCCFFVKSKEKKGRLETGIEGNKVLQK